jgi:entericidin A
MGGKLNMRDPRAVISTAGSCRHALDAGCGDGTRRLPKTESSDTPKENPMKRVISLLLLVAFSSAFLTACNTMAGAGKDVQKAGEKVEQKAEDCKDAHC